MKERTKKNRGNNSAEIEPNGVLKLTNDSSKVMGHAFYPTPFRFKNSSGGKAFSFDFRGYGVLGDMMGSLASFLLHDSYL